MQNEQKRFQVKKFLFETDHGEPVCFALLTDRLLPMVIPNELSDQSAWHEGR